MRKERAAQGGFDASRALWSSRPFHWLSIALACATVLLLLAGALVTSNEAGDSVPDWPMSFGRWLLGSDQFTGNVRYEYSHRAVAGVVGLITLLLTGWAWLKDRANKRLRLLALVAMAAVVVQALLGGVRVLLPAAKPMIAIPHAFVAQSFFCLVVSLAAVTSPGWNRPHVIVVETGGRSLRALAIVTLATVMIQLLLGAGFRHGVLGIVPHMAGAAAVAALVIWTARRVLRVEAGDGYLRRPALTALALLVVQLPLGVVAYIAKLASREHPQPLEPMISLTAGHVVVGALTLAAVVVLALRVYQIVRPGLGLQQQETSSRSAQMVSNAHGAGI